MTELDWQKSTYSEVASSCIYIATDTAPKPTPNPHPPPRKRHPQTILTTTPTPLAALISVLKGAAS